jgi:hypothetical protein
MSQGCFIYWTKKRHLGFANFGSIFGISKRTPKLPL